MRREYASEAVATEVLKSALWLAFVAAGGPRGSGWLQDRSGATKEDVFQRAFGEGDYLFRRAKGSDINADYVFGRMIKLRVSRPAPKVLEVRDQTPDIEYQSWCGRYPTYDSLFDAAEKEATSAPQA